MASYVKVIPQKNQFNESSKGDKLLMITTTAPDSSSDQAEALEALNALGVGGSTIVQNKLLGRGSLSGTGSPQEITLGTNLSLSGTTLNASGGGSGSSLVIDATASPYSAIGDGARADGVAMTSGSAVLTSTNGTFYNSGSYGSCVGKRIRVEGAGVAGADLITTILSYTNANSVTLAATASTTISAKSAFHGTDNTTAIQNAINACLTSTYTRTVYLPPGIYVCNLELKSNVKLVGPANTASEENLSSAGGTVGWNTAKSTTVLLPAVTTAPVILANDSTYSSFGCEVRDIQVTGSAAMVGDGIRGGSGWGGSGYKFGNATLYGVNVSGFSNGIVVSNATEVSIDNFCANKCTVAVTVYNVDDCLISRGYTNFSDTFYKIGGSKHTIIFSGCCNNISKFCDIYDSSVTVLDYNVESCSTSLFDLNVSSGKVDLNVNHIKALGCTCPLVRDYVSEANRRFVDVAINSENGAGGNCHYITANSSIPRRLPPGILIKRYTDTTWATLSLTRNADEFQDTYRQNAANSGNVFRPNIRYYEKFTPAWSSLYGTMGWTVAATSGTAWSASLSGGNLYFSRTGAASGSRIQATPWIYQPSFLTMGFKGYGVNSGSDNIVRIGIYTQDGTPAVAPQYGFGLKFDSSSDTYVQLEKLVAGTPTTTATTIAVASLMGTVRNVILRYDGTNISLAIFDTSNGLLGPEVSMAYSFPGGSNYLAPAIIASTSGSSYRDMRLAELWVEE